MRRSDRSSRRRAGRSKPTETELAAARLGPKPFVAIVGRPNVGKSTLFNRLIGRRLALVDDAPGVTRDRHYADGEWGDRLFTLIDTGGFVPDERETLQKEIREQARVAVEECDVLLFVVDGRAGLTASDQEVAAELRQSGKPTLVVVNKVDMEKNAEPAAAEFYRLGLPELFPVSAEHGRGIEALLDRLVESLPEQKPLAPAVVPAEEADSSEEGESDEGSASAEKATGPIRVAIVGRPNVGKSTLVNALLDEKRLITSGESGTTRDPIDSELEAGGRRFVLTDTAGIRRKAAIAQRVEKYAVLSALRALERSDVAVLVLDATEPGVEQDAKIAQLAEERGQPILVVVNKWDLARQKRKEEDVRADLKYQLRFIAYAPIVFVSAATGAKVEKVLELAAALHSQQTFRASTPQLNRLLEHITTEHPAPFAHGKALRLYYVAQVASSPPTFAFVCNRPKDIPDRYQRYIINQLREAFDLRVPIRLLFRERPGGQKRAARVAKMKARTESKRRKR